MIYYIINIVNISLSLLAIINWLVVICNTKNRVFIPPSVQKRMINGSNARLLANCFMLGLSAANIIKGFTGEYYTLIISLLCSAVLYYSSVEFKLISKEKKLVIDMSREILPLDKE